MQCAKYMVSTGCHGSTAVTMQGEGSLRAGIGQSVRIVACACNSGTPPPFLHKNRPRNPPGTPFLHRNPPPSCTGNPLLGPLPRPSRDPSWTGKPPLLPAQEPPFLDHFMSHFVTGISRISLQADATPMSEGLEDMVLAHPQSAQPPMVPLPAGPPAPPRQRTSRPAAGTCRLSRTCTVQ